MLKIIFNFQFSFLRSESGAGNATNRSVLPPMSCAGHCHGCADFLRGMRLRGEEILTAHFCLYLFTAIATFNWIDRGILPGSLSQIQRDLSLPPHLQNMLSGILQSLYILSYSLGSLYFGHAVHETHPFRLMFWTLLCWELSLVLSGMAAWLGWPLLLLGRLLSGVGEAAFSKA